MKIFFYYKNKDKGLLDSIVVKKNNIFLSVRRYTITNDKIYQIFDYNSNHELTRITNYSNYNGDKPSSVTIKIINVNQNTFVIFSGTISYNGSDVSEITLSADNYTFINFIYSYDEKHAMMLNVETLLWPLEAKHNVVSLTKSVTQLGQSTVQDTTTKTYLYNNDDYPISYNIIKSGSVNSNVNVDIIYEEE